MSEPISYGHPESTKCPICRVKLLVLVRDVEDLSLLLHEELECPKKHYRYTYSYGNSTEFVGEKNPKMFFYGTETTREQMAKTTAEIKVACDEIRNDDAETEKIWNEFWKPIIVKKGLDGLWQIKKELRDFRDLMERAGSIISHITNGRLSYVTYPAETVCQVADEVTQEACQQAIEEHEEERALMRQKD
jgi:hypothetical protein